MSLSEKLDFPNALTEKDRIAQDYLESLSADDFYHARSIAAAIDDPTRPLARTVVIIPVAAAQDAELIGHAMGEYSRQRSQRPFSVVLGLNIDTDNPTQDESHLQAALGQTVAAKRAYPELDIRVSATTYQSPTIGKIRRNLWDGVLLAHQRQGISPTEEIVGLNHDIDLVHLPAYYLQAVQRRTSNPIRAVGPYFTRSRHAFDPTHPNSSRLITWNDFYHTMNEIGYEAAAVVPMSFYAAEGGFSSDRATHEVGSVIKSSSFRLLRTGYLETSPRRLVTRLLDHDFPEIWTADSFGTADSCRDTSVVNSLPDLPADEVNRQLRTRINSDIKEFIATLVSKEGIKLEAKPDYTLVTDANFEAFHTDLRQRSARVYKQQRKIWRSMIEFCTQEDTLAPLVLEDAQQKELTRSVAIRAVIARAMSEGIEI
jgi:hypothetical protein